MPLKKNVFTLVLAVLVAVLLIAVPLYYESRLRAFAILFRVEKWSAFMYVLNVLLVLISTIVYFRIGEDGVLELKIKKSRLYIEDNFFKWVVIVCAFLATAFYGAVAASYYVSPVNIPYDLR